MQGNAVPPTSINVSKRSPPQIQIKSFIVKTIKLTLRPRMALNGAILQQQLTVHNTGAEPKKNIKMSNYQSN